MEYRFCAWGHPNIKACHKTTLEFTKDTDLSLEGDCIIGVKADFDSKQLRDFTKMAGKFKMIIKVVQGKRIHVEEIQTTANTLFNDAHEIVVRKTDFRSGRTLGIHADRAAIDLDRGCVEMLKNPAQKIEVLLESL